MKKIVMITLMAWAVFARAEYTEVMNPTARSKNLVADYGLVDDNAQRNQSALLQQAIDDLNAQGGGNLMIPKGRYLFSGIMMKSNVHLLIDAGTLIKPMISKGSKSGVISFDTREHGAFLENVSIRGVGGRYTIDYSDAGLVSGPRFIRVGQVRNFLIADANILDSYTPYSAMIFTCSKTKGANQWEVFRPTDGTIRDCSAFDSSHGYGLVQAHGAERLLFENLYSRGGVTLRFETGSGGDYAGVFDITGRNIVNENGAMAVVFFPHAVQNGNVWIDGVKSISSQWAVAIGGGEPPSKKDVAHNPNAQPGVFGNDSYVRNVHAIFGKSAQISKKSASTTPKEYLNELHVPPGMAYFVGPSTGVVRYGIVNDAYHMSVEKVTDEGFTYNKGVVYPSGEELQGAARWAFSKKLPGFETLADKKAMKNFGQNSSKKRAATKR